MPPTIKLIFFNKFIYLFIFGCVGSSLLCAGFLQLRRAGGYSSLRCVGFSLRWLLFVVEPRLQARGLSSCGSQALELRLSSCGARAQLLCGMWDLPRPGLEPMCPALAGRFLTIVPPGKFLNLSLRILPGLFYSSEQVLQIHHSYLDPPLSSSPLGQRTETQRGFWI